MDYNVVYLASSRSRCICFRYLFTSLLYYHQVVLLLMSII